VRVHVHPCFKQVTKVSVLTDRPAKKRCQYRVVYNIPSIPKPDESGSNSPDAKPEMTANPTQCPSAALKIVGECPHCHKAFCGNHRTPESHNW